MQSRASVVRAVLQVVLGVAVIVGAIVGNEVILLLAAMAAVGLILWEFEARRRRRA